MNIVKARNDFDAGKISATPGWDVIIIQHYSQTGRQTMFSLGFVPWCFVIFADIEVGQSFARLFTEDGSIYEEQYWSYVLNDVDADFVIETLEKGV